MPASPTIRRFAVSGALSLLLLATLAGRAAAGEFSVAACQADRLNFSTSAFEDFATRGMSIRRACNPEGPGLRGLVTANLIRRTPVRRGAVSMVAINAPHGTRFTSFRWAGTARRRDCRYALQLYADGPDIQPIPIKNVRANERCPRAGRAQAAGYRTRTFRVNGSTRIVQRIVCVAGRGSAACSARGGNYIRTYQAEVGIADELAPAAAITADTPLAQGEWVSGTQPLNYDASDNVGVRLAKALISGRAGGTHQRACAFAAPEGPYAQPVPCPNGSGQVTVNTLELPDGSQPLVVQAQDAAGNLGDSAAATARIDNTPPGRVDVSVEGGEQWRNRNDYTVMWSNPAEDDRAPITAASYKLCPVDAGSCTRAVAEGAGIARLSLEVPAQGEWKLSLWRRDAAGNQSEDAASVPVTLRYDAEPPQLGFEQQPASDPTLVSVLVTDRVSGLASGSIEISREGSDTWQALDTRLEGTRLVARVDDAARPAGRSLLRARAHDQAGNEGSTAQRVDGQPMVLTLPIRIASQMQAGVPRTRVVRRVVRRGGKRRRVRRRETVLRRSSRVGFGRRVTVAGQLANRDGQGIAGAEIHAFSRSLTSPEQLVAVLQTDAQGRYSYTATGTMSRTLKFAYAGSPLILPSQTEVKLRVPATSSLRVSRRRVLNGQSVMFRGLVRSLPAPAGGKLVELQVRLSGRWQTFRTTRTDPAGRWSIRYRFKRTRGVQRFRFRARLPREAGYPFLTGASRSLIVRVRGL